MKILISIILISCSMLSSIGIRPNRIPLTPLEKVSSINFMLPRKDGFWSEENINLLTTEQQQQLAPIKEKLSKGEGLSTEEAEVLLSLKEAVVLAKLGEADFKAYKNLIEKRKQGAEFLTPEDKEKLYQIRKKLKPANKAPEKIDESIDKSQAAPKQ